MIAWGKGIKDSKKFGYEASVSKLLVTDETPIALVKATNCRPSSICYWSPMPAFRPLEFKGFKAKQEMLHRDVDSHSLKARGPGESCQDARVAFFVDLDRSDCWHAYSQYLARGYIGGPVTTIEVTATRPGGRWWPGSSPPSSSPPPSR